MSSASSERQTYRVFVDTSVFSACEDEKYWIRESSQRVERGTPHEAAVAPADSVGETPLKG